MPITHMGATKGEYLVRGHSVVVFGPVKYKKSFNCLDKDIKYAVKYMSLECLKMSFSVGRGNRIKEKCILLAEEKIPKTRRWSFEFPPFKMKKKISNQNHWKFLERIYIYIHTHKIETFKEEVVLYYCYNYVIKSKP